jgi:hypothetical protein
MYNFQILCLTKSPTTYLETNTDLVNPLVYEGIKIEKQFGTDCIQINGAQYQVPVNETKCVNINGNVVRFGYFLLEE